MEDDQQFCLRWNNHQSTLVSVFDTLLEKGMHVDCTLAAEGQTLRAHKVVLSACSPYFESVLSQQYDKHPIIILKDVKFAELRAMMDYMYRGEVNISQEQLGALLKAAESLQIKGLSDNKPSRPPSRPAPPPAPPAIPAHPPVIPALPALPALPAHPPRTASPPPHKRDSSMESRSGSSSPTRRRKKLRRMSISPPGPALASTPVPVPAPNPATTLAPAPDEDLDPHCKEETAQEPVEDLTLDEEAPDTPSAPHNDVVRNFQWHLERSQDELMNSGDVGRDSQVAHYYSPYILSYGSVALSGSNKGAWTLYECMDCGNKYKHKGSLQRHIKYECRKQPSFKCPYCVYRAYQKHNLLLHERHLHKDLPERVDYVSDEPIEDSGALKCDVDLFKSLIHNILPIMPMKTKNYWTQYDMSYECEKCKRKYRHKSTYRRHVTYECGKEPMFRCPFLDCSYKAYQKTHTDAHIKTKHKVLSLEYKL